MFFMESFNKQVVVMFAATTVLVTGAITTGFSRERDHRRTVITAQQHSRPVVRNAPRVYNRHYSYRHDRWFAAAPHARMTVRAPFGALVLSLPAVFRTAVFGTRSYYYAEGVFYTRHPRGYEIVQPPRVRYLSPNARRVVVGGTAYFLQGAWYYRYQDGFFEVCEPPVPIYDDENSRVTTTIIIDNSNGSRTPVELEPLGENQWRGLKGEIYDGLPTNEQLRQAYGF